MLRRWCAKNSRVWRKFIPSGSAAEVLDGANIVTDKDNVARVGQCVCIKRILCSTHSVERWLRNVNYSGFIFDGLVKRAGGFVAVIAISLQTEETRNIRWNFPNNLVLLDELILFLGYIASTRVSGESGGNDGKFFILALGFCIGIRARDRYGKSINHGHLIDKLFDDVNVASSLYVYH